MKTALALLILAILATSALAEDESPVGRYQLYGATIEISGKAGMAPERELFRIDTKTGKVWMYISGQTKDGKFVTFWSPQIEESPQAR